MGIAAMIFQLVRDGFVDLSPLLGCQQSTTDEEISKRLCLFCFPSRTCFHQAVSINSPVLERNHAEEQIQVGIHGSFLNAFEDRPSTSRDSSQHREY
jgi:hypothetical protein